MISVFRRRWEEGDVKLSIAANWAIIMAALAVIPLGVVGHLAVNYMQNLGNSMAGDAQKTGNVAVDNDSARMGGRRMCEVTV